MNKIIYTLFLIYTALFSSSIFAIEPHKKVKECEVALNEKYIEVLQDCVKEIPIEYKKEISKFQAFISHKTGDYTRAEGFYIEFLKLNENEREEIKYSILLGELYVHQANFYEAIHHYSIAFNLNKNVSERNESNLNIAKIKMGLSNIFNYLNVKTEVVLEYKEIINILKEIKTKESQQLINEVYFLLSIMYANIGEVKEAEKYATKAYEVADTNDYLLGMGYAKKALSYAYILSNNYQKEIKAQKLIMESEEIFDILDVQDEIIFNLEIMKINIMIENKEYTKSRMDIMELEKKYNNMANNFNNLAAIYGLYYELYIKSNNKAAALRYKWKEIETNEEIRNEQNTHIVLKFKNEFRFSEQENEKHELVIDNVEKENEILVKETANDKYNIWIYLMLTLIILALFVFFIIVSIRKNFMLSKIKEDKDFINSGKSVWGEGYFLRRRNEKKEDEENFALIGYKIPKLEETMGSFTLTEINSFNLFVENTIKSQLRKGDVLFRKNNRLLVLSKANLDEAYFIALRLKLALMKNKYITDGIYFGVVNGENNNGIEESVKAIDAKIEKGIKKGEKIKI